MPAKLLIFTVAHAFVLWGSIEHLRQRTGNVPIFAALIAMVPMITPWFIVGLPFGMRLFVARFGLRNRLRAATDNLGVAPE